MKTIRQEKIAILIGLFILALIPFMRAVNFDFVWDDIVNMQQDFPRLKSLSQVFFPISHLHQETPYYRPWGWVVWYGIRSLFGMNPLAYHVVQMAMHGAVTILSYLLSFRLFQKVGVRKSQMLAVIVGILFAVHPAHVEVVAYVATIFDMWMTFFVLLGCFFWLQYRDKNDYRFWIGTCLCLLGALLSKETGMVLPVLLASMEPLFKSKKKFKTILKDYLGFLPVIFCYFLLRSTSGAVSPERSVEWSQGLPVLLKVWLAYGYYWGQIFLPFNENGFYYDLMHNPWAYVQAFLASIMIPYFCWFSQQRKLAVFGVLFFIVAILPALALILTALGGLLSERYAYLPSFGAILLIALLFDRIFFSRTRFYFWLGIFLCIVLSVGGLIASWQRASHWRTEIDIWSNMVQKDPPSMAPYMMLGKLLVEQGRLDEGIQIDTAGLTKDPQFRVNYAVLCNQLGVAYIRKNDFQNAETYLTKSVQALPTVESLTNLGIFYWQKSQGLDGQEKNDLLLRSKGYLERSQKANSLEPKNYYYLAHVHLDLRHREEAAFYLNEVVRLDPSGMWGAQAQKEKTSLSQ